MYFNHDKSLKRVTHHVRSGQLHRDWIFSDGAGRRIGQARAPPAARLDLGLTGLHAAC